VGRPIVFLSDLGMRDESVGACRLVIERIAPGTTVVDLSHGVPPQEVLTAILLADGIAFTSPDVILRTPTRVLDARDVFAPAAAWLASGKPLEGLGPSIDPASLVTRRIVEPEVEVHVVKGRCWTSIGSATFA
jgi:S-adenosylmethionine hydrolase